MRDLVMRVILTISILGLLFLALHAQAENRKASEPTGEQYVKIWDEGYYESKVDDCEQGFQLACDWLADSNTE
ncbi:hypothetical protein ACIRBX_12100 [Kitasatospora sp. NPDC096147]|uniref:hypothetical protein n=1 Tax=Kitasatospora sp. NPDC096147 TaxID=3364093 RepID=UPI0037F74689